MHFFTIPFKKLVLVFYVYTVQCHKVSTMRFMGLILEWFMSLLLTTIPVAANAKDEFRRKRIAIKVAVNWIYNLQWQVIQTWEVMPFIKLYDKKSLKDWMSETESNHDSVRINVGTFKTNVQHFSLSWICRAVHRETAEYLFSRFSDSH